MSKNTAYQASELIINPDSSIFHLHIKPGTLADTIILVGDPQRVDMVSSFFDSIESKTHNREFYTITGQFKGMPVTVLSTGIGTDNIDIVMNELDAVVNIDFESRTDNTEFKKLRLIRIGTSGAIQEDIDPGSVILSKYAIGFDGLLNFYKERDNVCDSGLEKLFVTQANWSDRLSAPYCIEVSSELEAIMPAEYYRGITASANGFYAPQGRAIRGDLAFPGLIDQMASISYDGYRLSNFEMECSALYGLSRILGHEALTVCGIIANRVSKNFIGDYKTMMHTIIDTVLNRLRDNYHA
ncbi:MAG: nucleoside phosphorylase [Bacteroidetes bacterium]|jgi:uridine phosphorylase|nr:nucleoside phosphorylase [Bacteroidota bacterium]MBT4410773.1 nucleoside phosphorylase [Bacteroidota bacterium]MBT7463399.1 nucleoside phosphorylase [Bacteroidota bacterium]